MAPKVIRSREEQIYGPVLAVPYQWYSAYYLQLPANLVPGNVVQVFATFEVTNPYPFNVQLDRYIAYSTSWGSTTEPLPLCPVTSSNVTPAEHHLRDTVVAVIDDNLLTSLGLSWSYLNSNYISLILAAASSAESPGENLTLEKGYGEIVACVFQ